MQVKFFFKKTSFLEVFFLKDGKNHMFELGEFLGDRYKAFLGQKMKLSVGFHQHIRFFSALKLSATYF